MNPGLAFTIARKLAVLQDYQMMAEAVDQIAELLVKLCDTDEQATWLLEELTLSGRYSKWGGPGWLKQIYDDRFSIPNRPELKPYEMDFTTGPGCTLCNSMGWTMESGQAIRCTCEVGINVPEKLLAMASRHKPQTRAKVLEIGRSAEERLRDTLAIDGSADAAPPADFRKITQAEIDALLLARRKA